MLRFAQHKLPSDPREVLIPPYRFWETRAGSGTPVVLIHGLGGSSDWWRRNVDALARDLARIIGEQQ